MWYSVWNKDMDVLVSWKHAPMVQSKKKKKQQWHRYGDTEQNDSGSTTTAQAKDKRTSLSTVDCMDESWCVPSYLILNNSRDEQMGIINNIIAKTQWWHNTRGANGRQMFRQSIYIKIKRKHDKAICPQGEEKSW